MGGEWGGKGVVLRITVCLSLESCRNSQLRIQLPGTEEGKRREGIQGGNFSSIQPFRPDPNVGGLVIESLQSDCSNHCSQLALLHTNADSTLGSVVDKFCISVFQSSCMRGRGCVKSFSAISFCWKEAIHMVAEEKDRCHVCSSFTMKCDALCVPFNLI